MRKNTVIFLSLCTDKIIYYLYRFPNTTTHYIRRDLQEIILAHLQKSLPFLLSKIIVCIYVFITYYK